MNNTFDIRRFGFLLRKTMYEKGLVLLGSYAILMVLILIFYSTESASKSSTTPQIFSFVFGAFSVAIFVNILLNNFSKKSSAASFLTLPCSNFEKWFSVFLIIVLVFLPLFLLTLKVIDTAFVNHFRDIAVKKLHFLPKQLENELPYISYSFKKINNSFSSFLSIFFLFGGMSIIGSLYFNQKYLLKTVLVFIGFIVAFSFLSAIFYKIVIGEEVDIVNFDYINVTVINGDLKRFSITVSDTVKNLIKYFMLIFMPLALWVISLVRFGDKEL